MRLSNAIRYLPFLALASASVIQPPLPNSTTLPKHYGVLLFDSFQIVDAFGPIELLASLAMLWPMNPMYLSILSATEHPVTSRVLNTPTMNHTHGFFGQEFVVTDTFANVLKNGGKAPVKVSETENKLLDIDVLIVPGGAGTRVDRTPEINFIREMYPKLQYIIGTCTGVTLMAKAGVLDGKEATSNKRAWSWVITTSDKVNWVKHARWVTDGNIWTTSGISAAIDGMLAFMSAVYGAPVADYLGLSGEYNRWPNATNDPFADIWD